jgi:hypothetical protein
MKRSLALARHPIENFLFALDLGAGRQLAEIKLAKGRLSKNLARARDGFNPFATILFGREIVEAKTRCFAGIR